MPQWTRKRAALHRIRGKQAQNLRATSRNYLGAKNPHLWGELPNGGLWPCRCTQHCVLPIRVGNHPPKHIPGAANVSSPFSISNSWIPDAHCFLHQPIMKNAMLRSWGINNRKYICVVTFVRPNIVRYSALLTWCVAEQQSKHAAANCHHHGSCMIRESCGAPRHWC